MRTNVTKNVENTGFTETSMNGLLKSRLLSTVAALASLAVGVATLSVPLLIVSGVFAYGWPMLYLYLTRHSNTTPVKTAHQTSATLAAAATR